LKPRHTNSSLCALDFEALFNAAGAGRPLPASTARRLLTIALMRLSLPDRLIPASLDVDGLKGLRARLNAGRTVSGETPALIQSDLEPALPSDYLQWGQNLKRRLSSDLKSSPIEGLRKW
jgi:hypothetical protein